MKIIVQSILIIVFGVLLWTICIADAETLTDAHVYNLTARIEALQHRVVSLEDKVRALQQPVEPGTIKRYCVETRAGVMECSSCRIVEER